MSNRTCSAYQLNSLDIILRCCGFSNLSSALMLIIPCAPQPALVTQIPSASRLVEFLHDSGTPAHMLLIQIPSSLQSAFALHLVVVLRHWDLFRSNQMLQPSKSRAKEQLTPLVPVSHLRQYVQFVSQGGSSGQRAHTPFKQRRPSPHRLPQLPQFCSSEARPIHVLLQKM